MNVVRQFLEELERGSFPADSAREVLEQLRERMGKEEITQAVLLIARAEAEGTRRKKLKKALIDIVPDGFLRDYLSFVQVSESPDSFHLFSILSIMSHILGRKAWFSLGAKRLYAPLSVFLVSPPGQARRSTAIRLACDVGRASGAVIVQDQATPEGLIGVLDQKNNVCVVADEAATLLSKREYMADMPALLCTLLDCPELYQRVLKGTMVEIEQPTTNALIGCAPEWILQALPATALGGGLLSRMLVVYEPCRKMLIPLPDDVVGAELMDAMKRTLAIDLRQITEVETPGPMSYSEEAKDRFRLFYAENDSEMGSASDKLTAYYSRKPDHIHRLALLLHMATKDRKDMVCSDETLERALLLLRYIEPGMEIAYRQAGLEKPGQHQIRVLSAIDKMGGSIGRSELLRRVSDVMDARMLDQVLATLIEVGEVVQKSEVNNNRLTRTYSRAGRKG